MSNQMHENQKNINSMRRNLTLDLNQTKKNNLNIPSLKSVLSSPDLNLLKVNTPDLEKMILENGMSVSTPTPTLLFPKAVTEEQESFATGFVNALNNLHNNNSINSTSSAISQASENSTGPTVYGDLEEPTLNSYTLGPVVKEEPQTVPNLNTTTPPMSPVDMEAQERIKLERKRQRNRLAASKCRTRKLERISRLEDKVKHLKAENADLTSLLNQLKQHVTNLKQEVLLHVHAGCPIMG
ncbi:transcription factor AP-1-like [Agrilus planipennis]|uniref:Transcription factor AP-1 n=1 Tax=Agrilus planipennis TaxID=224129 RepID=A0A1W4WTT0_AGRPL|nr:transcription factor AP-1 [Agrilus planipennis]XP_025836490.1 transcription factor AP-1-like [Agrilus planipennis]